MDYQRRTDRILNLVGVSTLAAGSVFMGYFVHTFSRIDKESKAYDAKVNREIVLAIESDKKKCAQQRAEAAKTQAATSDLAKVPPACEAFEPHRPEAMPLNGSGAAAAFQVLSSGRAP